jgi:hypothetical protein
MSENLKAYSLQGGRGEERGGREREKRVVGW